MLPNQLALESLHFVQGLAPVADAFAGTVNSDVVHLEEWQKVIFLYWQGVGTTGTSTITIEACDDATPSNQTAMAFHYRTNTSGDAPSAVTEATSSGFVTTAGDNHIYLCEVDADQVMAAGGYSDTWVRMKCVESVDSAVLGGIGILLCDPSHPGSVAFNNVLA